MVKAILLCILALAARGRQPRGGPAEAAGVDGVRSVRPDRRLPGDRGPVREGYRNQGRAGPWVYREPRQADRARRARRHLLRGQRELRRRSPDQRRGDSRDASALRAGAHRPRGTARWQGLDPASGGSATAGRQADRHRESGTRAVRSSCPAGPTGGRRMGRDSSPGSSTARTSGTHCSSSRRGRWTRASSRCRSPIRPRLVTCRSIRLCTRPSTRSRRSSSGARGPSWRSRSSSS